MSPRRIHWRLGPARLWPSLLATALVICVLSNSRADAAPSPAEEPGALCRAAIQRAEREARLPSGLLSAIALVESGRLDPRSGRVVSWPWTINAEGQGRFFESRSEAVDAVKELAARGVRVVDVGCMQVNLFHHPDAFPSLDEAFDPLTNARYAARFLTRLYTAASDWIAAVGRYHSSTEERAEVYRARVLAAWPVGQAMQEARLAAERARSRQEQMIAAWGGRRPEGALPVGQAARKGLQSRREQLAAGWSGLRSGASPGDELAELALAPSRQRCRGGARTRSPGCDETAIVEALPASR
ncbi:transglycosylase SLT domain-containing protein [Roseomonas sp. GCM10028921]